jgi:hypothetical protein
MRTVLIFITSLFCMHFCLAQEGVPARNAASDPEGFAQVSDTVIKSEVALFSVKAAGLGIPNATSPVKLLPIPLKRCNDDFAYFDKGTVIALEVLIHIEAGGAANPTGLKKIDLLFYKTPLVLPDSALAGIYGARLCTKFTKKNRPITADCKAYMSADKRRVYIYMLNAEGKDRYEVTWVVQDRKYKMRVVDPIPVL